MILMQQPLQTLCLLFAQAFTQSCHQTVIVHLLFIKSCMRVNHLHTLPLNHLGESVLGNVVQTSALGCREDYRIKYWWCMFYNTQDKHIEICFYSPLLLRHKMAYLIVVYFSPKLIHFGDLFSGMYYTFIILLAIVSSPQRLYQFVFTPVMCHFLLFCILSSSLQIPFYIFWPTPCLKTIILAEVIDT